MEGLGTMKAHACLRHCCCVQGTNGSFSMLRLYTWRCAPRTRHQVGPLPQSQTTLAAAVAPTYQAMRL